MHPELARALTLAQQGQEAEALELLQRLVAEGEPEATFTLGDAYWRGILVDRDPRRAFALFLEASEAGHPVALRAYTNLLATGAAGERNWQLALQRLEAEARVDGLRALMFNTIAQMDLDTKGDPASLPAAELLSERPHVQLFRQAFSPAECAFLMRLAEPTYQPSQVVSDSGGVRTTIRTSDGSTIHTLIEDPATHAINRRLAALSRTQADQGEPLQILRYRPGQEYRPHLDWLAADNPRVQTALIYLNDDYAGGETAFTRTGLKVKGSGGDALIFRSQAPEGGPDELSQHAGLPVTNGVKYLASRWIRASTYVEQPSS